VEEEWRQRELTDDPVKHTNARGTITFATAGPDTRTTQLFINIVDNQRLDDMGFAPVAWVVRGMDVVDRIFDKWGEEPDQGEIITQGNVYLNENFPGLSYIISAEQTLE
jgi:cyclophilin family peptidyl-prolyl cis-trans isomerase